MICHVVILYMLSHNGNKKLQLLLFCTFFRYKLFWIWQTNQLVYCEYIKFVSLNYILCLDRAFHCSENILLLKFNFFKTTRIYWLLCYFSKLLYFVGLKIELSQACRADLEKKQNIKMILKTSPTAWNCLGAVSKPCSWDLWDKPTINTLYR